MFLISFGNIYGFNFNLDVVHHLQTSKPLMFLSTEIQIIPKTCTRHILFPGYELQKSGRRHGVFICAMVFVFLMPVTINRYVLNILPASVDV